MGLTVLQLETDLLGFLAYLEGCGLSNDHALFLTLFKFGFRIEELKECHKWYIRPNNEIECIVSKKSNNRFIPLSDAPPLLIKSIQANTNYIYRSSYHTYKRIFESRVCAGGYRINQKRLSTHIFRHYVMKKLFDNGESYGSIASYFGLTSTFIVMSYVHSDIQYIRG